jgi:hypothetical protein
LTSGAKSCAGANLETKRRERFPPRHAVAPEIVFAPTTEIFRQLTAQPGWDLAGTQAQQFDRVAAGRGRAARILDDAAPAALLHEMLHVLVEAEASAQTPLWLREGLVEVLAGESRWIQHLRSLQLLCQVNVH